MMSEPVEHWVEAPCGHSDTYDIETGCRGFKWREPTVDDLNIEAAMVEFKKFWDRPFGRVHDDSKTLRAVLAAALGVSDE